MFATTTEFLIVGQRIGPRSHARGKRTNGLRINTSWFRWPRGRHSEKPEDMQALIEQVCAGPYLELFARRERHGWDSWGHGVGTGSELSALEIKESGATVSQHTQCGSADAPAQMALPLHTA